jgi:outer membrane protein assembly factor BamB
LIVGFLGRFIPVVVAVVGAAALALWLRADPTADLLPRVDVPIARASEEFVVQFPGHFESAPVEAPTSISGAWPNFRGANHDGVSDEEMPLAREWGPGGPKVLWTTKVGSGYAGPAVSNGRVFLMDYDEQKQADALRCLSLADGREIWRRWYELPLDNDHGFSRTVPAATERYVVSIGPKLHVMCLESATGSFCWGIDMVKEFKTKVPDWYAGQCPLIDRGKLILAPAGEDTLMTAIDMDTGKPAWQAPNRHHWRMTHTSIIPMELNRTRMYLYCASGGITAVAAEDGDNCKAGDILWERDDWTVTFANVPSPVVMGGGHILLAGGYGAGSMLLKLKEEGGKFSTDVVWRLKQSKEFSAEQHTPLVYNGYVYAVLPKNAEPIAGQLVCVDSKGKHAWESGAKNRYGLGPYMIADGLLFVMSENGLLTIAEATADGFKPLAEHQIFDGLGPSMGPPGGHEVWAPMAIAGGRLIVRDLTRMVCLDVRKDQ